MGFTMTCTPGQQSAVVFTRDTPHVPALVLHLDPVDLAIQLPPFPDGGRVLARFCRELAREAAKLATEVDPDNSSTGSGPRHLLADDQAEDTEVHGPAGWWRW